MQKSLHSLNFSPLNSQKSKQSLRSFYKKKTDCLSLKLRRQKQKQIVQMLKLISFGQFDGCIAVYRALKDEPCLSSFYNFLKNKICFPVVQDGVLNFYKNEKDQWRKNQFQILEPLAEPKNRISLKDISVFFIPGRVFDRRGGRLGRSYGYYDKTLARFKANKIDCKKKRSVAKNLKLKKPFLIGVSFVEQIHNEPLPLLPHDVFMDMVLTDRFVIMPLDEKAIV